VDRTTIKSILERELGWRKFTRIWASHILSAEQKLRRVTKSQSLLTIWANLREKTFKRSLQNSDEILRVIREPRNHFTFEEFQNTSKPWMEGSTWVIVNNEQNRH
jgi:hypothetical protein